MSFLAGRFSTLLLLCCCPLLPVSASGDVTATQVRTLYERGEYERAVEAAEAAAEPSPDLVLYHGLALARLERFEQARIAFQRGRDSYPRDKRFPLELAGVAYRAKRIAEAKSFLRQALRVDPSDHYGNNFLGSLHLLDGNLAAALKYWNRIDKPLIQGVVLTPPPALAAALGARAIAISGGQIFTLERLRATEGSLDRLNIFARRQFELGLRQDERFDLTVRLLPMGPPLTGWLGRLLPMARGLPYRAVHFDQHNIANRAVNFKSLWRWDARKRRVDLELAGPIRLQPRFRYRVLLDARDEDWDLSRAYQASEGQLDDLKARKIAFGGDFVFALNEKLEWTTGLRIARREFQNHDGSSVFADSWSFEQQNQLAYRLLDLPEHRVRVDSSTRLRTGRVVTGAPGRFGILEGDLSASWKPLAQGDAWEAQARLRAGKTFGEIPFDEFFQLGMERDNDLWLRGHRGTRQGRKGNAPLGTDYALVQTGFDRAAGEFRFLRVRVGPFFDAGRISGPSSGFGSRGWLLDTGLQAKVIAAGGFTWSFVYGRDLRGGRSVFYTAVQH